MKLFKNIMSRKPDPEEIAAMEAEAAEAREMEERSRRATTDDSGEKNASLKGADDLYPGALPPEPDTGSEGWSSSAWSDDDEDEDWDDEDWADEWDDDDAKAGADTSVDAAKAALVEGLRDAARDIQGTGRRDGIRNWSEDEELARADEERILSRTNSEMTSIMSSRRRSAMAHLKKAAQATKADRVLSHVVGRDAAGDPEEQSPYRDDLAKVVKPRATSRPVSRPVSRSPKVEAEWEGKPADSDAAMMAEASETLDAADAFEAEAPRVVSRDRSIFEAERQQHLPADLTEDEFTSDDILVSPVHDTADLAEDEIDEDFEEDDDRPRGPASWSKPLFENTTDDDDDEAMAVAIATRRASRVRTALVDPVEEEDEVEEDVRPDIEEPQPAEWGLGGAAAAQAEDDADDEEAGFADETDNDFADFADDDYDDDEDEADWSAPSLDAGPGHDAPKSRGIDLDAVRSRVSQMRSDEALDAPAPAAVAEVKAEAPQVMPDAPVAHDEPEPIVQVPTPAVGRAGRSAGRVKTRLLGFQAHEPDQDVFDKAGAAHSDGRTQFPVGWIVVVEGPGRGTAFTLKGGVMQIGRGAGQGVQLDFGDTAISRENHAAIAFDDETGKFFLGHGGKSNLVRLNGAPVLSTEELTHRDRIRIGETTLMLVELCNEDFIWTSGEGADDNA